MVVPIFFDVTLQRRVPTERRTSADSFEFRQRSGVGRFAGIRNKQLADTLRELDVEGV
jgi:hypothetical protein